MKLFMRGKLLRVIGVASILMVGLLSMPLKCYAALAEPTGVTISHVECFEDLITTGDVLIKARYGITFTTNPDENADETYIFRLLSADGLTEIGRTLAIPTYDSGYGNGDISFYSTSSFTWEAAYIIRVQQNPTYYPLAQYWDFTITSSSYSDDADQAEALRVAIINEATFLQIGFDEDLLSTSEAGIRVLSSAGEYYFTQVIPGLQSMTPGLFSAQFENPDYTRRTWSTTLADDLLTKYEGTFIYDSMTGFAGLFSVNTPAAMNFLSMLIFAAVMWLSIWKFKGTMLSSFVDGYAVLLLLMLGGFFSMIWAGFIAFASGVLGGVVLFLNKS